MSAVDYRPLLSEYADALHPVRLARNILFVLLVIGLLVPLAGFVILTFTDLMEPGLREYYQAGPAAAPDAPRERIPQARVSDAQTPAAPATQTGEPSAPAEAPVDIESGARTWRGVLGVAMEVAKAMLPILAALLMMAAFFASLLSLVGRLGGAKGFIGATLWALILLALLLPWSRIFPGMYVTGAPYTLYELLSGTAEVNGWAGDPVSLWDRIVYYARFVAYPILALAVLLVVHLRFARGYRTAQEAMVVLPVETPVIRTEPGA